MNLDMRLHRIEATLIAQELDKHGGPAVIFALPDCWPEADRLAFDGGDPAVQADALERNTGKRPGPRTKIIVLRLTTRPDGPQ